MAGSGKRIFQTKGKVLIKLLFENELKKNIKKKTNRKVKQKITNASFSMKRAKLQQLAVAYQPSKSDYSNQFTG